MNTYTQAKIVLKENTIVTFFPTNTRWMKSPIPVDCVDNLDLAMKLITQNIPIPQDKWLDKNTLMVITHLLPDDIMQYIANQWSTPLYAHQKLMAQPPEQMHRGMIDECWVKSQEQSYLNSNPKIMLLVKNPLRIAAQKNLMGDQSKIPKSLKKFCPVACNPIILYKPPYSDNQELVKQYMGQATICPTMELWWEESNHTPLPPPTVPAMPTPLSQTVPALAQIT